MSDTTPDPVTPDPPLGSPQRPEVTAPEPEPEATALEPAPEARAVEPEPDTAGSADAAIEPPEAAPGSGAPQASQRGRIAAYGAVALAIVLALGAGILIGRATAPAAETAVVASPTAAASAGASASPSSGSTADLPNEGNRLGGNDAKVVVDYWADYQCPFCARFAEQVIPALASRIADGTVALVHRDYAFLGPESVAAARAVQCAARDGRYWAMHDALYAAQQGENQGAFADDRLAALAEALGLDATAFGSCMAEHEPLLEVLDSTAAGVRSGIQSTPTVEVNGRRFLGVPDVDELLAAVDAAAVGASPAPQATPAPSSNPWSATETRGRTAGSDAAPVTVELWMDYQATDSAAVAKELGPELRTRIDAGAIRVEQHDLAALGDESVAAAAFVACVAAQDGPAWFVHDVLAVSAQGAGAGLYVTDNLLRYAVRLGLDIRALDACLADPAVAAAVRADTAAGQAAGLAAGPAVVVRRGDAEVGRFTAPLDVAKVLTAIDASR